MYRPVRLQLTNSVALKSSFTLQYSASVNNESLKINFNANGKPVMVTLHFRYIDWMITVTSYLLKLFVYSIKGDHFKATCIVI